MRRKSIRLVKSITFAIIVFPLTSCAAEGPVPVGICNLTTDRQGAISIIGKLPERNVRIIRDKGDISSNSIVSSGVPLDSKYWLEVYGAKYNSTVSPNIYIKYTNRIECDKNDQVCVSDFCAIEKKKNGHVSVTIRSAIKDNESIDDLIIKQGICELGSISVFANDPAETGQKVEVEPAPGRSSSLGIHIWRIKPSSIYAHCASLSDRHSLEMDRQ